MKRHILIFLFVVLCGILSGGCQDNLPNEDVENAKKISLYQISLFHANLVNACNKYSIGYAYAGVLRRDSVHYKLRPKNMLDVLGRHINAWDIMPSGSPFDSGSVYITLLLFKTKPKGEAYTCNIEGKKFYLKILLSSPAEYDNIDKPIKPVKGEKHNITGRQLIREIINRLQTKDVRK